MSSDKKLEEWLKQAARSPELKERLARAECQPSLSDELIAEYYAGTLTAEEIAEVGRRVALSGPTSMALAQLHSEAAQAAAMVAPAAPWRVRVVRSINGVLGRVLPPAPALRLVGAAAALILVVLVGTQLLDRPPSEFGPPYISSAERMPSGEGKPRGSEALQLPGGRTLQLFDPEWPLHAPQGSVGHARWFSWDSVEGASSYRFELLDHEGRVLFSRDGIKNCFIRLPWLAYLELEPRSQYLWVVEARDSRGSTIIQALGHFLIKP